MKSKPKGKPTRSSPKQTGKKIGTALVKTIAALVANEAVNRERINGLEGMLRNLASYGAPYCEEHKVFMPKQTHEDGLITVTACPQCVAALQPAEVDPDVH